MSCLNDCNGLYLSLGLRPSTAFAFSDVACNVIMFFPRSISMFHFPACAFSGICIFRRLHFQCSIVILDAAGVPWKVCNYDWDLRLRALMSALSLYGAKHGEKNRAAEWKREVI